MRNRLLILISLIVTLSVSAQNESEAYTFLRSPAPTRINALSGHTVALVGRDPPLIFHNPALLGTKMDGMINLNCTNYISDINVGSALFTKAHGEKGAWGVGVALISYGDIKKVLPDNVVTGVSLSMKDTNVNGFYSHNLNERWRGGLLLKFLYSGLADYTSVDLYVDVELNHYNSDKGLFFGFVLKSIGAQLKAYEDGRQKVP